MAWLVAASLFCTGLCLVLYLAQRRLIYFPRREVKTAPAEVLYLPSEGETLKLWVLNSDSDRAVLYFGGNAEEVSRNIPDYARWFPEMAVYLVNYRGYAGSTGRPSEAALFADALHIYDELASRHGAIAVIGRSLGSGVAVYLASQRPVWKLVLVTPFDSVTRIARRSFPFLPTALLLKDHFDSVSRAAQVQAPVLLLVAGHDGVITQPHSDALAAAFPPSQRTVELIADADHNTINLWPAYADHLRSFLDQPDDP